MPNKALFREWEKNAGYPGGPLRPSTGNDPAAVTIATLTPNTGTEPGGTSVVIAGTNFYAIKSVKFGTVEAAFVVNSATQITAITPAHVHGAVSLVVTKTNGTTTTKATAFTYGDLPALTLTSLVPAEGPSQGRTSVAVVGTNLYGIKSVKFGAVEATSFVINSRTSMTVIAPAGEEGVVDFVVTEDDDTVTTKAAGYEYTGPV
jgi:hypothetical protein